MINLTKFNVRAFKEYRAIFGNILVGFSFLLLTLITVKTFAPDVESEAANQTASETIGPYTMSMSNDSVTNISIVPTASQQVYSASNNLSVINTCSAGATITMTTNSISSNSLTRTGSDSLTKEIAATTATSLDNNSWGYALNNSSTYYAVPKKGTTAATIYNASAAQTSALSVPVKFGVKTNNELPSGTYSNDVVYTMTPKSSCLSYSVTWNYDGGTAKSGATYPTSLSWGQTVNLSTLTPTKSGYTFAGWTNGTSTFTGSETAANLNSANAKSVTVTAKWTKITIYDINYMHEMTPTICANTTTPAKSATSTITTKSSSTSYIPQATLTDYRDNKTYIVRKYANGECWMAQNLEFDFLTSSGDYSTNATAKTTTTLNPTYTDIEDTASFNASTNAFKKGTFYATQKAPTTGVLGELKKSSGLYDFYAFTANSFPIYHQTESVGWEYKDYISGGIEWPNDGAARSYSNNAAGLPNYTIKSSNNIYTSGLIWYTASTSGEPYQRVGNYYNWTAATAGTASTTTGIVNNSICPKNWQLPSSSGNKSFLALITYYYGSFTAGGNNTELVNRLSGKPLDLWRTGLYFRNFESYRAVNTNYWHNEGATSTVAYSTDIGQEGDSTASGNTGYIDASNSSWGDKNRGYPLRCVAR